MLSPQFCFKWITLSTFFGLFMVYAARLNLSGRGILRVSCFSRITQITSRVCLFYLSCTWRRKNVSYLSIPHHSPHQTCNFNHAFIFVNRSAYWHDDFSSPIFLHGFSFIVHEIFHGNLKMFHIPSCFKKCFSLTLKGMCVHYKVFGKHRNIWRREISPNLPLRVPWHLKQRFETKTLWMKVIILNISYWEGEG